jgi:MFS transporter, FHS family, glucose/mannose:H+ symporter
MFAYAIYFGAIGVLLPAIGAAFHVGPAITGRLFPADLGGFVVGVISSGYLSDRLGRKSVLALGLVTAAVGLLLFAHCHLLTTALLAACLIGCGNGAMETVACAFASDLYPEKRAILLNLVQVAFGGGASIGPSAAYWLLNHGVSWSAVYQGIAAATAALFLFLLLQKCPPSQASEAIDARALLGILRHPEFQLLCAAQALYVAGETGFFSWLPTLFQRTLPGGAAAAGLCVTLFWVAVTIGRLTTGALIGRLPLVFLTMLMALGGAAASACTVTAHTTTAALCGVFITGLCFSGIFGLVLAAAAELYPDQVGTVFGGVVAAGGAGGAIVPWLIGILGDSSAGWRVALLTVPAAMGLLAGACMRLEKLAAMRIS